MFCGVMLGEPITIKNGYPEDWECSHQEYMDKYEMDKSQYDHFNAIQIHFERTGQISEDAIKSYEDGGWTKENILNHKN